MKVRLKRNAEPYQKGEEFHVLGINWNEAGKFTYYAEKDNKRISIDQQDADICNEKPQTNS